MSPSAQPRMTRSNSIDVGSNALHQQLPMKSPMVGPTRQHSRAPSNENMRALAITSPGLIRPIALPGMSPNAPPSILRSKLKLVTIIQCSS